MKIQSYNFASNLQSNLANVYIFSSDEPFWLEESTNMVFAKAKSLGFDTTNRYRFSDDAIDLNELQNCCESPGIFADKVFVILNLSGLKTRSLEILKNVATYLNSSLYVIITLPQLSNKELAHKSLAPLDKQGVTVVFYPSTTNELIQLLMRKAQLFNIRLQQDAALLLIETYEGNIFAMVQSLEKLSLSGLAGTITADVVRQYSENNNHYSIFSIVDSFIDPNFAIVKRLRMLNTLHDDGYTAVELVAKVGSAITALYEIRYRLDHRESLEPWYEKHPLLRTFKQKRALYERGAQATTLSHLSHLMRLINKADILARSFQEDAAMLLMREIAVNRNNYNCLITPDD